MLDADVLLLRHTEFFVKVPDMHSCHTASGAASGDSTASCVQPKDTMFIPVFTAATEHNRPFFAHAALLFGESDEEGRATWGPAARRHAMMSGEIIRRGGLFRPLALVLALVTEPCGRVSSNGGRCVSPCTAFEVSSGRTS